jgi:hypothetical protein
MKSVQIGLLVVHSVVTLPESGGVIKCRPFPPACGFKLAVFGSLGRVRGSQCPRARVLGSIRPVPPHTKLFFPPSISFTSLVFLSYPISPFTALLLSSSCYSPSCFLLAPNHSFFSVFLSLKIYFYVFTFLPYLLTYLWS